jgi:hypothetical protein
MAKKGQDKDSMIIRIIAGWDWKIHLAILLIGLLYGPLQFVISMSGQGKNPFDSLDTSMLLSLTCGLEFLFVDYLGLFFVLSIGKWIGGGHRGERIPPIM